MGRKNMTLRLLNDQAEELEAVARADGISVAELKRLVLLGVCKWV